MTKICSWDVGIKNLAYCIIEKKENSKLNIIKWDTIDLIDSKSEIKCIELTKKNIDPQHLCLMLINKLSVITELTNVDKILIENQPCLKNPTMKTVSCFLFAYNQMQAINNTKKTEVKFCNASNKLKIEDKYIDL